MRPRALALRQRPRLGAIPYAAGDSDDSDVVNDSRSAQVCEVVLGQSKAGAGLARKIGDPSRMAEPERRLEVGEVAQRLQSRVEPLNGQLLAQRRIEFDDLIPGLERPPSPSRMTSGCAQKRSTSSGSNWVPRRSRATATAAAIPPVW